MLQNTSSTLKTHQYELVSFSRHQELEIKDLTSGTYFTLPLRIALGDKEFLGACDPKSIALIAVLSDNSTNHVEETVN